MFTKISKLAVLGFSLCITSLGMAQPNFDDVELGVLQVRDNIWMIHGAGGNAVVHAGEEGILVVDTKFEGVADKLLEAIRSISDREIRYVINTHYHMDHTGGNAPISQAGSTITGGNFGASAGGLDQMAQIVAHENVLFRMSAPAGDTEVDFPALPTNTYFTPWKDMWFNNEGIRIMHFENAHSDGDSIVHFRHSDLIVTGDLFNTEGYPFIDLEAGGTYQGYIDAVNAIIDLMIPVYGQDGGTLLVPGHGRVSNLGDILNWREMLTIVRDRIQYMIGQGMSLEQIIESEPTMDYDARYDGGFISTERFISTVYESLSAQ